MKKIILTIIIVFNFGVISNTFAASYDHEASTRACLEKFESVGRSGADCYTLDKFMRVADTWAVSPIKKIFGTLFVFIAASGAVALFFASLSSIFKEKDADGDPKSPVFGWLGLFLIVPLLIYIFYEFNYYAPYGYYRWVFTITLIGLIFYGVIELFRKKTPKSK